MTDVLREGAPIRIIAGWYEGKSGEVHCATPCGGVSVWLMKDGRRDYAVNVLLSQVESVQEVSHDEASTQE